MKDDVKVDVANGTPKTLIPSNGGVNWDGVLKSYGRLKSNHATHFWGWIERPIAHNSIWKCSYVNHIIKGGPMMWVSSTMDGNRQKRKWLVI
jgi:hypothetical protein